MDQRIEKAPAFYFSILFIIGILCTEYLKLPFWGYLISILTLIICSLFFSKFRNYLLIIIIILTGAFCHSSRQYLPVNHISTVDTNQKYTFILKVLETPSQREKSRRFTAEVLSVDGKKYSGKALVYVNGNDKIGLNDIVEANAKLLEISYSQNFNGFNYKEYLYRKGVYRVIRIYPQNLIGIKKSKFNLRNSLITPIKGHIAKCTEIELDNEYSSFLRGILLGNSDDLDDSIKSNFRESGVIHVLAVSGLHVGLIALIFFILFNSIFRLKREYATIATILLLVLYAFVTDLRPSVIRASIMISVYMAAFIFKRKPNVLNSIGLAAIVLLLINTNSLFDLGFQLSFLAVLGIVVLYPKLEKLIPPKLTSSNKSIKYFVSAILISLSAQITTLPVIAWNFHQVPIIAPISNLFIIPLVSISVALGFSSVIFGIFSAFMAGVFNSANYVVINLIYMITNFLAHIPMSSVYVKHPSIYMLTSYILAIVLILLIKSPRKILKRVLVLLLLVFVTISTIQIFKDNSALDIYFLDVGQGDCIYIEYPNGRTMLIDGGNTWNYEFDIEPFLFSRGISEVDDIIITHSHIDHYGGIKEYFLSSSCRRVYSTYTKTNSKYYGELIEYIQHKESIEKDTVFSGDTLKGILPVRGKFIWPDRDCIDTLDANNQSLGLIIEYGEFSIFMAGDIEKQSEDEILKNNRHSLNCDIYKASHHSAITSNTLALVNEINPTYSIISVGKNNKFGHPDNIIVNRLEKCSQVFRTDINGAVWIRTDGKSYRVTPCNNQ